MNETTSEANGSRKMLGFLVAFRWVVFIAGLLSLTPKEPVIFANIQSVVFIALVLYQLAASLFTIKGVDSKLTFITLLLADVACGAFLVFFYGNSFFLIAAFVPLMEVAYFYPHSIVVAAALLAIPLFIFIGLDLLKALGEKGNIQQVVRLVAQQLLLGILFLWFFIRLLQENIEISIWQKKGVQERELLHNEVETLHNDREKLIRELRELQAQKVELEQREKFSRTQMERLQLESDSNLRKFFDREQELMRRLDMLSMEIEGFQSLINAIETLYRTYNLEETLVTVVELVTKSFPCQTCVLFLADEMSGEKRLFAEVVGSPYANMFKDYNVGIGEETVGWAAKEGEPVLIENSELHTVGGMQFTTLLASEKSCMVIPLLDENEPVGALYVGGVEQSMYSWREVDLLMKLAPHLAGAIKKAQTVHKKISRSMVDDSTCLFNKVYFNNRLNVELKRAGRYKQSLSLILLEVDLFSSVHDRFGAGTTIGFLKEITDILRIHVREIDVMFYLDNGCFAILLVQAQKSNAILIAERVRLAIDMRRFGSVFKQKVHLTVSIGVADFPDNASNADELINKVKGSLQEAKSKGGNTTCFAA